MLVFRDIPSELTKIYTNFQATSRSFDQFYREIRTAWISKSIPPNVDSKHLKHALAELMNTSVRVFQILTIAVTEPRKGEAINHAVFI